MASVVDKYLAQGETSWADVALRVAGLAYPKERAETETAIRELKFIPGSPILRCALTHGGLNLMSCHNIQVGDSIPEIWEAAGETALILKSGGGGVGLDFSKISPYGTPLKYAREQRDEEGQLIGIATGPTSFMGLFRTTSVSVGGHTSGKTPGLMATLNANHPDILKFIELKKDRAGAKDWRRFNLSVTLDSGPDDVDPDVWAEIIRSARHNGEPGVIFLDNVNRLNPTLNTHGRIETVNVCAENPDYPYGACCLGSIRLPNVIQSLGDYYDLCQVVKIAVRYLNRVIDMNHYPLDKIRQQVRALRRIGIGVMGWWDLLTRFGIPFWSDEAQALAKEIATVIYNAANLASTDLAIADGGYLPRRRRNVTLLCIAPNGHIARIPPEVSPSIYPNIYDKEAYAAMLKVPIERQIEHIAAWQSVVDGGVSYTITLPGNVTPAMVDKTFRLAHERGLKAISVYRDGAMEGQPCEATGTCAV